MFHLTPQEKTALAGLLTVCVVGLGIRLGLDHQSRPLDWSQTVSNYQPPPKPAKPRKAQKTKRHQRTRRAHE